MIFVLLLITEIGQVAPTVLVVGVISYLLFYVLALIRDLDNPFEYRDGKPSAADVNLDVLEHRGPAARSAHGDGRVGLTRADHRVIRADAGSSTVGDTSTTGTRHHP